MTSRLSVTTVRTTNIEHQESKFDSILIDSSGRCFKPNLPYFVATRNTQPDENGSGFMTFTNILSQRGNWYNGANAVAPSTGLYSFFCKTLTNNDSTITQVRWYINGATSDNYGAGYSGNWSGHKYMYAFATFYLQKNDSVSVFNSENGTRCCGTHNTFMGYMIGG